VSATVHVPVRRTIRCLLLLLTPLLFILLSTNSYAGEQGLSVGYGFAAFNKNTDTGEIERERTYNFLQLTYFYENPYWRRASVLVEPFAAYINRPESGVDVGFDLLMRWYPFERTRGALYFDAGAGVAYTSIALREQGTRVMGILVAGIGLRYKTFFIEDRFRHYSNGATAYPNRSVNANVLSVGMYF
jgi:hypothetical protein